MRSRSMLLLGLCVAGSGVFAGGSRTFGAEDRLWLIRQRQPVATIVPGRDDDFAAERLQRHLFDACGVRVPVVPAHDGGADDKDCTILLGSRQSNPAIEKLAGELSLEIDPATLTTQGYVARWLAHRGHHWLILAGGGPEGVLHAVVDLIHEHLHCTPEEAWLGPLDTRQVPRFPERWLWTWDNRMDWGGAGEAVTVMGGGTSRKTAEGFLTDYRHCIDFMADHKFNGLIIWGFLRDNHGGVAASQELCDYAVRRGVRILPGVGTSGYAGYYYQGHNPFNAATWLAEHPELRAIDGNGRPHAAICPSKKANQDWLDRGAEWLVRNFHVGGVNLEMGDFFVCYCDDCRRARAAIPSQEPDYYKDMAVSHQVTLKSLRRLAPEAWLSYATYTGYTAEMMTAPPKFLSMIPEDAICQWTLTGMARNWPAAVRPMARHNVGYLHWCNSSTKTQDSFYLEEIFRIGRQAAAAGLEGLVTYGELSDQRPNAELFYLAWEACLWQPELTIDEFLDRRLAPLYGGTKAARTLLEIIPLVRTPAESGKTGNLARALDLAASARASAAPDGQPRWDRLLAMLHDQQRAIEERGREAQQRESLARQGRKVEVLAVRASDEDRQRGWDAAKAIDGSVEEPGGYWLTRRTDPRQAWIELQLAEPSRVNRLVLFHQLNPGHYRSLDYTASVRVEGQWKPVVTIRNNQQAGWVAHPFDTVTTDALRVEITRSAFGNRMGLGEIELRYCEVPPVQH